MKVARLKSGDPYIFGRVAEEALTLIQEGYKVEVINGLSSSIAGLACAGLADDIYDGVKRAGGLIDGGLALERLKLLQECAK